MGSSAAFGTAMCCNSKTPDALPRGGFFSNPPSGFCGVRADGLSAHGLRIQPSLASPGWTAYRNTDERRRLVWKLLRLSRVSDGGMYV